MPLPQDYEERVYAGVLGKIIGVYLGRPFEGWAYKDILEQLGEINYYVHEKRGLPLVVTDDDISGTFTFLRALEDNNYAPNITPEAIGNTWLNYIIENKAILWWGGMGSSSEHTAFIRLKNGIPAPKSGSIATNTRVVAEQIGSQIFIDGWGMIWPGDPEKAADYARRAASVSHDGEAIYGAQVVAAMEALAFIENDISKLIAGATALIPRDSIIYRLIQDLQCWHAEEPDWKKTREKIQANYGYDKYGGGCHMVPNHALIIHALLHGDGDFQKSLMIVNTCGWDTDCNSGNVGCLLGIRNGLQGIEAGPDWRGPVADRIYLPTADGGRCVTDAVRESYEIVKAAQQLHGLAPEAPKEGARFHFSLPGSVQGFQTDNSPECRGTLLIENEQDASGNRSLALRFRKLALGRSARALTPTFPAPEDLKAGGYMMLASPTLYPGQKIIAKLLADTKNESAVTATLILRVYDKDDKRRIHSGPSQELRTGDSVTLEWTVPDMGGFPIDGIGLELTGVGGSTGTVYLSSLTWSGTPQVEFRNPGSGQAWQKAWVQGVDFFDSWSGPYRVIHNSGRGLLLQGTREWQDYTVRASVSVHMARAAGIAARVQGMKRYYALLLTPGNTLQLVKMVDTQMVLAETNVPWELDVPITLELSVKEDRITGSVDGRQLFEVTDAGTPLTGGGIAFVVEEGRMSASLISVG